MSYRLLLPCFGPVTDERIQRALDGFECLRTGWPAIRWAVCDLAGEPEYNGESRLTVTLAYRDEVRQESDDMFFHAPRGVQHWIVVQVKGERVDRAPRLHARLVALTLAERLNAPVLETRNGVYCRTPAAFAAWCSREPHPHTVLLGRTEHVTSRPARPRVAVPEDEASRRECPVQSAPLPRPGWLTRLRHRLWGMRPYVITLPPGTTGRVARALVAELEGTFHERNVVYEPDHHRLVVFGKDTPATQHLMRYYRRRAHPERLRMTRTCTAW